MTRKPSGHDERLKKNDESLNHATNHREPWSVDEVAFLLDWNGTDEELGIIAECLGRTREACRERFYKVRRGEAPSPVKAKKAKSNPTIVTRGIGITTQTDEYIGSSDNPDDQWWSPNYYNQGSE